MTGSMETKISTPGRTQPSRQTIISFIRKNSTLIVLLLLWVGLSVASNHFLTSENILNILLQASNIGIMACGMTLVIVAAEIDLSVGSVEALAGSVAAVLMVNFKQPAVIGILGALLAGLTAGAINGFFTSKVRIPSFIATLGMLSIARGFALIMTGGRAVYDLPEVFKFIGQGKVWIIPFPIILAFIIFVITWVILRYTRFGMNVYAVGSNATAATLSGISPAKIRMAVLTLSGVCAAIAGMILASRLNSGNGTVGASDNLDVIAAVVIGGTSLFGGVGTIVGTLIGVLLVSSIRNGLNLLAVSAFWQQVAIGTLILLAVLLDYLTKVKRTS
jgi:ribose/xylose/arabinose/galactoside ABC-type transport system permease subunit